MARQKKEKVITPPTVECELKKAEAEWLLMQTRPNLTWQEKKQVVLAEARVWALRATDHHNDGEWDAAHKASRASAALQEVAIKMEKSSLADRVAELEARQENVRSNASVLANLGKPRGDS